MADSYKQSTFDSLFFVITMQVDLGCYWFKVCTCIALSLDRGNDSIIYMMLFKEEIMYMILKVSHY